MAILEDLKLAIKDAMLAKDKLTLQNLRGLSAAFKQIEIDQQIEITEEIAINELQRQIKKRQEAARQFADAGRQELADKELAEIEIIQRFLPAQLSADEWQAIVHQVLAESALPKEPASLGKLMPALKAKLQGRVDMGAVSAYVRQQLQA